MPQLTPFLVVGKGAPTHFSDRGGQQALPGFNKKRRGFGRPAPEPDEGLGLREEASALAFVAGFQTIEYLREVGVIAGGMEPRRKISSQSRAFSRSNSPHF